MSVATADLHKAINTVWDASGLEAAFLALRDVGAVASPALHDQDAGPEQPWPYCVFEQTSSDVTDRMSADGLGKREIRDVSCTFQVHARTTGGQTAKQVAAGLAEELMKVYGGHPVDHPAGLTLDHGEHLITQYMNDYGIRTGDDEHMWTVVYNFRLDVPVAV